MVNGTRMLLLGPMGPTVPLDGTNAPGGRALVQPGTEAGASDHVKDLGKLEPLTIHAEPETRPLGPGVNSEAISQKCGSTGWAQETQNGQSRSGQQNFLAASVRKISRQVGGRLPVKSVVNVPVPPGGMGLGVGVRTEGEKPAPGRMVAAAKLKGVPKPLVRFWTVKVSWGTMTPPGPGTQVTLWERTTPQAQAGKRIQTRSRQTSWSCGLKYWR